MCSHSFTGFLHEFTHVCLVDVVGYVIFVKNILYPSSDVLQVALAFGKLVFSLDSYGRLFHATGLALHGDSWLEVLPG